MLPSINRLSRPGCASEGCPYEAVIEIDFSKDGSRKVAFCGPCIAEVARALGAGRDACNALDDLGFQERQRLDALTDA